MVQFAHKSNISVAIVCMVNHTALNEQNNNSQIDTHFTESQDNMKCSFKLNSTESHDHDGEFLWSKTIQQVILSSYFYGYIVSQVNN
jgi:hypothetical protein